MAHLNFYKKFLEVPHTRAFLYEHFKVVLPRLPEHYKRRYLEAQQAQPNLVHFKVESGNWKREPATGALYPMSYFNIPPVVIYPKESDKGLWGGEGLVIGFRQKKPPRQRHPRTWRPGLQCELFYSEILDRWMKIIVTTRTILKIEENKGFDYYILKTSEMDLKSRLGMHLKRDMLRTLATKSLYPDNAAKREAIYEKYKEFLPPVEEIEWIGLTLDQAVQKQLCLEWHEANKPKPVKEILLNSYWESLESNEDTSIEAENPKKESLFKRLFKKF